MYCKSTQYQCEIVKDGFGVEMLVKLVIWLVGLVNVVNVLDDIICIVIIARLKAIILCCGHLGFLVVIKVSTFIYNYTPVELIMISCFVIDSDRAMRANIIYS